MGGYITMLPMVGDLNEKQQEYGDKIKAGIDQMTELIERLLNLGRIEAGAPLILAVCDVAGLLSEAYETFADEADAKELAYELDLPEYLPHIPADATFFRQALINLVQNAVKFTPEEGSVTVGASVDIDAETLTIAVKDTGPGIKSEDLDGLFTPFFRGRDRRTATIEGSGVGLAIVKGVAERHGGRVRVTTEPGKGSTFYLDMPLNQPEATE
jgi:signal transduction histidine kinase